jgi:hypothetical protein
MRPVRSMLVNACTPPGRFQARARPREQRGGEARALVVHTMRATVNVRALARIRSGAGCIAIAALLACRPSPGASHGVTGRLTTPQLARTCAVAPSDPRPWQDEPDSPESTAVSLEFLSERSRQTLDTLGLRPAMARLVLARARVEVEGDAVLVELVRAHQTLTARLHLVDLEISAVAAEVDCHEAVAESVARSLQGRNEARARGITAAAISVGAVFGITAGALELADYGRASVGVAIAGGITEVGLGLGFLWTRGGTVFVPIERNFLHEIWEGSEQAQLFPPAVWALLQAPRANGRVSTREELVTRWRTSAGLGRIDSAGRRDLIALLFAPSGGRYDIEALELRLEFLDQLEAELNLLSADLHELLREILAFDRR